MNTAYNWSKQPSFHEHKSTGKVIKRSSHPSLSMVFQQFYAEHLHKPCVYHK